MRAFWKLSYFKWSEGYIFLFLYKQKVHVFIIIFDLLNTSKIKTQMKVLTKLQETIL